MGQPVPRQSHKRWHLEDIKTGLMVTHHSSWCRKNRLYLHMKPLAHHTWRKWLRVSPCEVKEAQQPGDRQELREMLWEVMGRQSPLRPAGRAIAGPDPDPDRSD